ncbi:MAG TPA: alanine--glyoxylate aminotransferase family protein [Thermoanaerobaculia bacterium]|nr:alanine--glyoxylate aminotransferase family protein [Thermoanaerobaculia bacterium]
MPAEPRAGFHREPIRFFLPGPSYVLAWVREALTGPVVAHRSASFKAVYASVAERLREVFRTEGEVYTAVGSATLVMESAILSLVPRRVLHLTNGAFSERWHAISLAVGREADRLSVPWGEAVDPDLVRAALARGRYDAVALAHSETATGVLNPLAEIARVVREHSDTLVLVDAVSSLGGTPVETDAWGLDLVLAGVQKGLAAPPGLTAFTFSERAAAQAATIAHRGFYTDLLRYRDYHRTTGSTITTAAVSLFYALERQLGLLAEEGVERRFERHATLRQMTERFAAETGLVYASKSGPPSPTVSCLRPPAELPARRLVERLAEQGITVGSGYGEWKESTFRIGHMGEVQPTDLEALFSSIHSILGH